ncbi:hypothetical protein KFL_003950120 [Klebsormidium nitens]|uniref:PLAC8 family protein n=1 Tax=Klebsormidium nitens TaxID=105231 RepID=A0A1Y1IAP5_KLENI|nr:hypothetical protein KFL_003950120 [Klebsormidium nitens]|eukprot:GAQ88035.1 hypothetical protein KFL_003950120 [Klebsormidium nitens]
MGLLCPCVVFGWNVEQLEGECCCPCIMHVVCTAVGCVSCYASAYRTRIRAKYNLVESPCGDCCTHFWCHCFALCQEYRQLKKEPPQAFLAGPPAIITPPPTQQMQPIGYVPGGSPSALMTQNPPPQSAQMSPNGFGGPKPYPMAPNAPPLQQNPYPPAQYQQQQYEQQMYPPAQPQGGPYYGQQPSSPSGYGQGGPPQQYQGSGMSTPQYMQGGNMPQGGPAYGQGYGPQGGAPNAWGR